VDLAGFEAAMRALAALSSWWVLNIVLYGLIVALLVLRRFRHLIVLLIVAQLVSLLAEDVLAAVARRPRPFGVVIGEGWAAGPCPRSSCCSSRRRLS